MNAGRDRNGHAVVGMYTSFSSGYCGTGGNIPTTLWGLSFMVNALFTTVGSPPKLLIQYS